MKIAWGITGAGDYVRESFEVMRQLSEERGAEVTVLLSKSGDMVIKWYKLKDELTSFMSKVLVEKGANSPFMAGPLQVGHYDFFVVSPVTGNTTAKVAHGIADTLITNCIAQTVKGGVPVYLYPVDQRQEEIITYGPQGESIRIISREVDLDNVEKLRRMRGITVLSHPKELLDFIK